MAAIDPLLRAALRHRMEAVVLEAGRLPRLRRGDVEHEVTQSALDERRIAQLVAEIAPAGAPPPGPGDAFLLEYGLDGRTFKVRGESGPGGWRIVAELAMEKAAGPGAAPPAEAPAPPAAAAAGTPAAASEPATGGIRALLDRMLAAGASDLHLTSGEPPRLRVHGELAPLADHPPLTSDALHALLYEIAPGRNRHEFETANDTDFAYELPGRARFRVNLFRDHRGVGGVLRTIPQEIPTVDQLGLPEPVRRLAFLAKGLVLVTGPTGSGKSTTLAALIDLVNRTRADHIIAIEDPIEFVHPPKRCLVNQREVGVHTASFKSALRAALREDPDVVLVGEMRDLETTAMAIETAETGHLVFGTLHTSTAASTIERLIDQFPGDRQGQIRLMLAESLRAVIAQTLLRRIAGGRVAAYEILIATPAISNLIREGKTFQIASAMQIAKAQGMVVLNDALMDLVQRQVVAPRDAYLKAVDKEGLLAKLKAGGFDVDFLNELKG
jgi:twitching motility protein PilT